MQKITSGFNKELYEEIYGIKCSDINDFILKYYTSETIKNNLEKTKKELNKKISKELQKTKKILEQKDQTKKAQDYKEKGDLISAYIYKLQKGDKFLELEHKKIELDPLKTPSENAQRYYNLYKKAKNSIEITNQRKKEAKEDEYYLKEKLFSIENASTIDELLEIEENKEDKKKENKNINILKIPYKNYDIFLGKNSKQNDYLISKIAKSEDFWFHAKDNPSCHLIIKNPNKNDTLKDDVLLFCAKTIKENSTVKNSKKASIIYTKKKYLRKAQNKKPGLFIYENEKEIVVE